MILHQSDQEAHYVLRLKEIVAKIRARILAETQQHLRANSRVCSALNLRHESLSQDEERIAQDTLPSGAGRNMEGMRAATRSSRFISWFLRIIYAVLARIYAMD